MNFDKCISQTKFCKSEIINEHITKNRINFGMSIAGEVSNVAIVRVFDILGYHKGFLIIHFQLVRKYQLTLISV